MCETYYCQECGCEIRNSMDIGTVGSELRSRSLFAGCKEKEYWTETVIICASCMEAANIFMEKIAKEFEIDAAFEEFYREYEEDKNLREVLA